KKDKHIRSNLRAAKRVVVKVGSRLLAGDEGAINRPLIRGIVDQLVILKGRGIDVLLVTSGAIAAGRQELGMEIRPKSIPGLQAAAAVGQAILMHIYHEYFSKAGCRIGQVLLTRDGFHHRDRHLNVRHTIQTLLEEGIIPIINENDTVAVDELKFGDNDHLAALVANLIQADLLIILTDVDGLLSSSVSSKGERKVIPRVDEITPDIIDLIEDRGNEDSRGGMKSKLEAVEIVTRAGGRVIIAHGAHADIITRIMEGKEVGTYFPTGFSRMRSRKCWIAFSCLQKGRIIVDSGARRALVERGKSLLASGIIGIEGEYEAGDMISIVDDDGEEFCRGLVNYSSEDLEKIKGENTDRIESILGYKYYDEAVHRDNLLIL
ncbi:MAG: glutamate 5-kinase, partial [Candidatus Auribacterota bacterium]|nr:glutamate 5-kinase [Candidatus Auribacterota bacterium]